MLKKDKALIKRKLALAQAIRATVPLYTTLITTVNHQLGYSGVGIKKIELKKLVRRIKRSMQLTRRLKRSLGVL